MAVRFLRSRSADAGPDAVERDIRRARVEAARHSAAWSEVDETALVEREGRFLVDADSDAYYTRYAGVAFAPGTADVIANQTPLSFVVSEGDRLEFLEGYRDSWSERIEHQARRRRRREAPRERPAWMDARP